MNQTPRKDYYDTLGVTPSSNLAQITKSYKKLAKRYHPDRHSGNELQELAEEKLRQLNEAFEILSNPQKRADYDSTRVSNPTVAEGAGPQSTPTQKSRGKFTLRRTIQLVVFLAIAFFAMRFIRSPRAMAMVGIALAIAWFGPRLIKLFKR